MSTSEDRREGHRHHVYLAAEIVLGDAVRSAITKEVSASGLLVLTRAKLAEGQSVRLRVYLPGDEDRALTITGEVVRREELAADERGTWRDKVAVAFDQPQPELAAEFAALAAEQARIYGW